MKLFGFEVKRIKNQTVTQVPGSGSWFGIIRELYSGAWQSNVTTDAPQTLLAFSAVYACATTISGDIGKLRLKLMREVGNVTEEVKTGSPFLAVLKKPNHYQNRIKFLETWITSKLLNGNAYALKRRDDRGVVRALYPLDPNRVTALIAEDGSVWYDLRTDNLAAIPASQQSVRAPASEIIHDPMVALWHPLVGVSPLYACAVSATMGNKIQANSTNLFGNASRPSGILTAPGAISAETATSLKTAWETNFSGANVGRLAVLGDGLKYESIVMKAEEAQLIEQLKWTVEDIARAFKMPLYKIGGPAPSYNNIEALAQMYYSDCLQVLIESLELSLDEGLELPTGLSCELDLENLFRMDSFTMYERNNKAVAGGWFAPNEARQKIGLPPVPGGESPLMQQQNWTLSQLAERPPPQDKASVAPPAQGESPEDEDEEGEEVEEVEALIRRLTTNMQGARHE